MNSSLQKTQKRLLALGFSLPRYGADGDYGKEADDAFNAALDQLEKLRGLTATPPTSLPPPVPGQIDAVRITSAAGRKAITQREDNVLTAYKDSAGILTIGVGHTSAAGAPRVTAGMKITAAQSDEILSRDLKTFEEGVRDAVRVPLGQNEFDALVSLAFNIGVGAFSGSTLVKKLNAGDRAGAAAQFGVWVNAGGKKLQGLVNRREAERKQFLS